MENASKALIIAGAILISILLITIGIVLVNSGRGVSETGTANVNSQKIQAFNSQFTPYEGNKKGSELKDLMNVVIASNATNPEHMVTIYYQDRNGSSKINSTQKLLSSKTYSVQIHYSGQPLPSAGNPKVVGNLPEIFDENFKTEEGYIDLIQISN